ncbi:MAG: hypothetical protein NT148_00055, partial [Candidatus Nealsonbacteria bacterium]|nr:hypothetical protein [Candidatus Nealsonbacteria bacterium]
QQKEALQLTQKYNPGKLDDLVEASPQWIVTDLDNDDKSTRALKHSIRKGLGMVDARGNAKSIAAGSRLTTATRKTFSNNLGEFIRKMPTDGFKNISESMADGKSEQSKLFMQSLIENGRSSQVSAMTEGLSGRGTGYIEKALNEQLAATNTERTASGLPALSGTKEYLQQTNPRLHDYFTTGQGKGLISLT